MSLKRLQVLGLTSEFEEALGKKDVTHQVILWSFQKSLGDAQSDGMTRFNK